MSSIGAARRAAVPVSDARALASRRNGAKSCGPKTAAGKARSSRNALKHGLCATKLVVFAEDAAEFRAFEKALLAELAPKGAVQGVLAQRAVSAAWRLRRADRFEAEVLDFRRYDNADLGVALMRDGNGPRSVESVMRYRGAAMAEFLRALKTLQALQAEAAAGADRPAAPARRRVRPPASKRTELEQMRQRNPAPPKPTTATPANKPRHDAPEQKRPADHPTSARGTKPTQESKPKQTLDVGSTAPRMSDGAGSGLLAAPPGAGDGDACLPGSGAKRVRPLHQAGPSAS